MSSIRAVKGMPDILPQHIFVWQHIEQTIYTLLESYAYQEIRFPIVESTYLFKRAVGEVTDIVEKEMYTFDDRNADSLSLRPEGTAGCVRACIQNGLLREPQRLWYKGPMFRYERPQKGRQRQFHQIGLECFGWAGPDIDVELILLSARLWQQLGIADKVELQINSLGDSASRVAHKKDLLAFLHAYQDQLDEDSRARLETNPLRILDSKNATTQALLDKAPNLLDYLDTESQAHFAEICGLLEACAIKYTINPRLVRGLDYYNRTVFEWVTDALGAQGTICAGGRYDTLVAQLGGKSTPAVGMAMGLERLCLMLDTLDLVPTSHRICDIYVVIEDSIDTRKKVVSWIESLRTQCTDWKIMVHCGGGSFKSQLKKADKSGAQVALIIGEQEIAKQQCIIKPLRLGINEAQFVCAVTDIGQQLKKYF